MADVTLWDIGAGAKATWAAAASLTAIVPADRVYLLRAAEGTPLPYCVIEFQDVSAYFGGTEYFSGGQYVKVTRVDFGVYGTPQTDWGTLSLAMSDVFGWTSANPRGSWVIANATVLSAMPEVEGIEATDVRVDGQDVVKYASSFSVRMQANRD